jgi:non-ribosomal peptide synthetase component E (peptide arylation enzyme)
LDKDGFLYVSGRIKEMIVRGGENIYPKEIENFLQTNPMIAEAYVTTYLTLLFKKFYLFTLYWTKGGWHS